MIEIHNDACSDDIRDPAISRLIGATSGLGYVNLIGRLESYPLPRIPIKPGDGDLLLDVGCNWRRWSISRRARVGMRSVSTISGRDHGCPRALANERNTMFVCGDARFLPFNDKAFQWVFSYSVVQHFAESDAKTTLAEIG
jgi:ubiquinone/menaquinone biosynthesis C-methylase UbiE